MLRPGWGGFFMGMVSFLSSPNGNQSVQYQTHQRLENEK
jgi:hypothetical protein